MINNYDKYYKISSTDNMLWEPVWQLSTKLYPIEKTLLKSKYLRRLHFIRHGGGAYLNTHYIHSRLQHTLGVFSLVAYFYPDNVELRLAALLHDIGHAPFSHTVERIKGVDHHRWTEEIITESALTSFLMKNTVDTSRIMDFIEGRVETVLQNKSSNLHLDHLDSFVRSAYASGTLTMTPVEILGKLRLGDNYIHTDVTTAKQLLSLIINEAKLHCSFSNIVANNVIKEMVELLIKKQVLSIEQLKEMIDSQLESLLLNNPLTCNLAQKLWYEFDSFQITNEIKDTKKIYYSQAIEKLYLSIPLVDNQHYTAVCQDVKEELSHLVSLKGDYHVWKND
jgi:uncharacterized protein